MTILKTNCPVCNSDAEKQVDHDKDTVFYKCPICGRFQFANILDGKDFNKLDFNRLGPYLFYHRFSDSFDNPE